MRSVYKLATAVGTVILVRMIPTVLPLVLSVLKAASADLIQAITQLHVLRQMTVQQTLAYASMGFSTFVSASTLSAYRPEVAVEAILAMRAPATVTALLLETHATTVYVRQQEAEVQMLVSTPTTASSPSILFALSVCVSASMQSVLHPPTLMNVPPTQVAALELHVKMVFVLTTPIALVQLIVSLTLIFAFCREFVLVSMVFVDS